MHLSKVYQYKIYDKVFFCCVKFDHRAILFLIGVFPPFKWALCPPLPPSSSYSDSPLTPHPTPLLSTWPVQTINERSLMQQYAANFGQLLESALGRPENAKPFADAGGDEVLLTMFPLAVPGPRSLLARASCAWGHSSQVLVVLHEVLRWCTEV